MATQSITHPISYNRRARWKTLGFAACGAGISSLIFSGLPTAFNEEHFAYVVVIMVIATLVFFDRITELVLGLHSEPSPERVADRTRLLICSIGIALLIVVLHQALEKALTDHARSIAELLAWGFIAYQVTAAWVRGTHYQPHCAASKGAFAGAFFGGICGVLNGMFLYATKQGPVASSPNPEAIRSAIQATLLMALVSSGFGFVGGLAIDKHWGSTRSRGILFGLCLLAFPLGFGLFTGLGLTHWGWDSEFLRVIFVALGWGGGLILHAETCELTLEPGIAPMGSYLATSNSTSLIPSPNPKPRPNPKPMWEFLLVLGLVATVLVLWREATAVKKNPPLEKTVAPHTDPPSAGNSAIVKQPEVTKLNVSGSETSVHHRAQPIPPRPSPVEMYVEKARAALVKGHLIYPEDDSAIYWARRAKLLNPQNGVAIQIEQLIFDQSVRTVQIERKAKQYSAALTNLAVLESLYPNRADLERLRFTLVSEQRQEGQAARH
jgi:hypothetical protein